MSVIVRGMEMPNGCEQCCFNGYTKCRRMPIGFEEYPLVGERPDWCPLIEIPTPHGRLIDAESVYEICGEKQGRASSIGEMQGISKVWKAVKRLPPVIEAEGRE